MTGRDPIQIQFAVHVLNACRPRERIERGVRIGPEIVHALDRLQVEEMLQDRSLLVEELFPVDRESTAVFPGCDVFRARSY